MRWEYASEGQVVTADFKQEGCSNREKLHASKLETQDESVCFGLFLAGNQLHQ